jgi:hypothetical protein
MRALFVLLAIAVAAAYAQVNPCNSTEVCIKVDGTGCSSNTDPWTDVFCASGTQCMGNTCVKRPTLGQSCDNSGSGSSPNCFDPNWSISCGSSNLCVYSKIYGPGESCKPGDAHYENGGCLSDLTSDANTKKCSSVAVGGSCNGNSLSNDVCAVGSYCDGTVCTARKAAGATCQANHECTPDLVCTNKGTGAFTCQAPFGGAAGAGCDSNFDCGADLICDNDKCVAKSADGQACQQNVDICAKGADCVCDKNKKNSTAVQDVGTAACANSFGLSDGEINTAGAIDAFKSMQNCLVGKKCHDFWMTTEQLSLRAGPSQCIQSCLKGDFQTRFSKKGTPFNTCDFGNAAGSLVPALLALIALVAALLF